MHFLWLGAGAAPPPGFTPRPEVNRYIKISATAEPSSLPRDVSPSDFHMWLMKFTTYSNASWVPGPPTSGEKLRQLNVYLGTQWSDVLETVDQSTATYEDIINILSNEISITFPVVRRRIELFSIQDQMASEGPWEFWRRIVLSCKQGAIGSRETGLDLTYDQLLIALYLKGLKEGDREKINSKFLNYEASFQEMEEMAKQLEQSNVSLKTRPKTKGSVNAISSSSKSKKTACAKCKSTAHQTSDCKSTKCSYCNRFFHAQDQCWANPSSSGYKGAEWAKKFWSQAGKTPPASSGSTSGNLLALPAPSPSPAPASPQPGSINAVIAVASLQNGALVQSLPTPRIRALRSDTGGVVHILPDSGATMNIACRASADPGDCRSPHWLQGRPP